MSLSAYLTRYILYVSIRPSIYLDECTTYLTDLQYTPLILHRRMSVSFPKLFLPMVIQFSFFKILFSTGGCAASEVAFAVVVVSLEISEAERKSYMEISNESLGGNALTMVMLLVMKCCIMRAQDRDRQGDGHSSDSESRHPISKDRSCFATSLEKSNCNMRTLLHSVQH